MKPDTFDGNLINDGTNYESFLQESAYGLEAVRPQLAMRTGRWPVVAGVERPGKVIYLDVYIRGSSLSTLQKQLHQYFDPEDETPKKLICEDQAGGNDRYVYAICREMIERDNVGRHYVVGLQVHGDIRWRENTASTSSWNITASGQTKVLANNGEDDAYPILAIEPTSAKTGGYAYKRFVVVKWIVDDGVAHYPVDICNDSFNTATLVSGGKMQADGDDLRVWVDGVEVERWLDGINTSTTKVWVNMNFEPQADATLGVAIASSGSISTITASTDISDFPSVGILLIDSELFVYTGKNNANKQFTGVTRAAKGTGMAAHTTTDTIYWIQHEVWIAYGNSSASAPTVDANNKPVFALASSTNASWDFDDFYQSRANRSGVWGFYASENISRYGGNQGASATTYAEMGIHNESNAYNAVGTWQLWNPCELTSVTYANGEKRCNQNALDYGSWEAESFGLNNLGGTGIALSITEPSTADTWESWSGSPTLPTSAVYVFLKLKTISADPVAIEQYLEAADVTVGLNNVPSITIGSEQSNYLLDAVITNNTTGDAIGVEFHMVLNQELEIDTDAKTVIYLADDSSQFQTLDLQGDVRRDWLRLQPGNNTIQFDDTGTNAVTIDFEWEERHYD